MAKVSSIPRAQEESRTGNTEGLLPLSTIPTDDRSKGCHLVPNQVARTREQRWAHLEGTNRTRRLFAGQGSGTYFPRRPGGCLHQRYPQCGLCRNEGEHLAPGRSSDRRSSARERIYYWAVCLRSASLYTKLKKAQEDAEYSTDKLLSTIQENENLKARLIQAEKAEAEGLAASEQFESLQAEVLRLGAEVEGWLDKCREQNEEVDRLRGKIERCRAIESEAVRLKDEVARLRAKLEVSKDEAQTAMENFKDSDICRKMIYDHGGRLYANGWVNCREWMKEHNPYLDIFEAKWPGEEEAEEEERLAKMLTDEAGKEEGFEDEGATDEEVEAVEPDLGDQ
ncbi:hypothetical protein O6P43_001856 [Quillaja saponaria]|uniref:Uncharacterized protein n=1 Tax=Quillaja saponaria TaxID=32244 RepID=A0AAD7QJR0_QUISA|nr:hypothetical protein O6P43_001856 [Quillaja saponaria]